VRVLAVGSCHGAQAVYRRDCGGLESDRDTEKSGGGPRERVVVVQQLGALWQSWEREDMGDVIVS
jgi:hypothetical protein